MDAEEKKHTCIREEQINKHEGDIVELKARADFKDQRIEDLKISMREVDKKLDDIKDEIQNLQMQSAKDDSDIDNRVTALENTVKVLKWASMTIISLMGVFIAFLSFTIMHLH